MIVNDVFKYTFTAICLLISQLHRSTCCWTISLPKGVPHGFGLSLSRILTFFFLLLYFAVLSICALHTSFRLTPFALFSLFLGSLPHLDTLIRSPRTNFPHLVSPGAPLYLWNFCVSFLPVLILTLVLVSYTCADILPLS